MSSPNETRVWFVTDVRGSSDVFGKILNVVRYRSGVAKKPDVVLVSGNLTGGELCVVGVDAKDRPYAEFRACDPEGNQFDLSEHGFQKVQGGAERAKQKEPVGR